MGDLTAYGSLFATAFLAATLLPAQSEILLAGMHAYGDFDRAALVLVATMGNTLGSAANWLLGRYLVHFKDRRWFPVKPVLIDRATGWYQRWGLWSLLLAWAPFIGDPLTLVAGILRVNLWLFLALVGVGKLARYLAVVTAV
jgi:membrane protein YqaA with SNARE-associated domain